jgi:hypothetical protein
MAGIARENVSRIVMDLTRRKLISRVSGYYCIENKSGLQREIGGAGALVPTGPLAVQSACGAE